MRILLHSPKDMVAGALAAAAVSAIIANALFLQAGRHPSPMFGTVVTLPPPHRSPPQVRCRVRARSKPRRDRPIRRRRHRWKRSRLRSGVLIRLSIKSVDQRPRSDDQSGSSRPMRRRRRRRTSRGRRRRFRCAASNPPVARRVAAVQRALTEYGYGQLKPTGTVGADTQAAIQKFERERKLPVTGQMSDRLVRELTAVIGRPIE